jgi:hypothetical protein
MKSLSQFQENVGLIFGQGEQFRFNWNRLRGILEGRDYLKCETPKPQVLGLVVWCVSLSSQALVWRRVLSYAPLEHS